MAEVDQEDTKNDVNRVIAVHRHELNLFVSSVKERRLKAKKRFDWIQIPSQ